MAKFRVLSLDGGGIRGLLTTLVLKRLTEQPELAGVFERIDLIAGNSSGALIALGMAHGLKQTTMPATLAVVESAFRNGQQLFGDERWFPFGKGVVAGYPVTSREASLQKLLGQTTTLGQLNRNVLITSFDLDNNDDRSKEPLPNRTWKPKIFHNFTPVGANTNLDRDLFAWKVGLYSTAAITYFPTADGFVDAGVYANNPSMCALAQVFDRRYDPVPKPADKDIVLLSIGSGQNLKFVRGDALDWGVIPWVLFGHPVQLVTDGTVGVADYECRQMLGDDNYFRLAPAFPPGKEIQIDDLSSVDYLTSFVNSPAVEAEIQRCTTWLRREWLDDDAKPARVFIDKTSKHVNTSTELTCLMPIKPGFVPALDTRTYATRIRLLFRVLQGLRVASREARSRRPILDIVDAARTVHSFSWAIVGERQLLLSVTFDRPWEPYIRAIWKDLGPLMDLILCSVQDYPGSSQGFEKFAQFVRDHQVEAGFFYPASKLTIEDGRYLEHFEASQRVDHTNFNRSASTIEAPGPERIASIARKGTLGARDAKEQWLAVLEALFALRLLYPPGAANDDLVLERGAKALLGSFEPPGLPNTDAYRWFKNIDASKEPDTYVYRELEAGDIQGGILEPYHGVSHGALLLARIDDPAKARAFLANLRSDVTCGTEPKKGEPVRLNIAFSYTGLKAIGVKQFDLDRFPKELREGMEARAGLLGDIRQNHPQNWTLPEQNVRMEALSGASGATVVFAGSAFEGMAADATLRRVRMSSVDMVITVLKTGAWNEPHVWNQHPLRPRVEELCLEASNNGVQVLSVQPLKRLSRKRDAAANGATADKLGLHLGHDHFGFADGISQPTPTVNPPTELNDVSMGELFVGFANDRKDAAFPATSADPAVWTRGSIIDSGSFLVVRKLRQNVPAFEKIVAAAQEKGIGGADFKSRMMGRTTEGMTLTDPQHDVDDNNFDFTTTSGETCPFHAHIRRANPRVSSKTTPKPRALVPRIMRRGLAYGPVVGPDGGGADADRGIMFMAYNASIAEQFEVVQRWMTSGNPPSSDGNTRVFSGQPDPLLGLPDENGKRVYRFNDRHGHLRHVDLGETPFVSLQWGIYLFAPSMAALNAMTNEPAVDMDSAKALIQVGKTVIENISTFDEWTAVLEDFSAVQSGTTRAVLAAIRQAHGGVLRTPYGVLVASKELVLHVLRGDPAFSVREYQRRFSESIGESYLGMDPGPQYRARSEAPNTILMRFADSVAYAEARKAATIVRDGMIEQAMKQLPDLDEPLVISLEDLVGLALGQLSHEWFDIPDVTSTKTPDATSGSPGEPIAEAGGGLYQSRSAQPDVGPSAASAADGTVASTPATAADGPTDEKAGFIYLGHPTTPDDARAFCPFHFVAPSRFVFSSPNPRLPVQGAGKLHGQLLRKKARELVAARRASGQGYTGPIAHALREAIPNDDDFFADELIGLAFGFIPPVLGNTLQALFTWLLDESFWRVQDRFLQAAGDGWLSDRTKGLKADLAKAMQAHAVPPLLHRTVTAPTTLGDISLAPGERVVLSIASVMDEDAAHHQLDVMTIFGGDRQLDPNHPTHSCPGYSIATGVMLGVLTAILELPNILPGPTPLTICVPRPGATAH